MRKPTMKASAKREAPSSTANSCSRTRPRMRDSIVAAEISPAVRTRR